MNKKYMVRLTDEERHGLETLVSQGKAAARKISRAWILLKADAAGPAWSDEQIRTTFAVGLVTIYRVRQSFVEEGLEAVLTRRPKSRHRHRKLDGEQEAHLIALACGKPPPRPKTLDHSPAGPEDGRDGIHRPRLPRDRAADAQKTNSSRTW